MSDDAIINDATEYLPEDFFLIDFDLSVLDQVSAAREASPEPFYFTANVFLDNLVAAFTVASCIWVFAKRASFGATCTAFLGVRIGSKGASRQRGKEWTQEELTEIRAEVSKDLEEQEWDSKAKQVSLEMARNNLVAFLRDDVARDTAADILRHCTVVLWSAFEVLASDLFVTMLDKYPETSAELLKDDRTKKFYHSRDIFEALEFYGYDLSKNMGEVLLGQRRMDNLETIRAVYAVIFNDNQALRDRLNDENLWRLYKKRNLIVHRAAVVDDLFLEHTGLKVEKGKKLPVSTRDFKTDFELVCGVGAELLKAIQSRKS